jgi:multiple sugar transport system substrate-binding protein
MKRFSRRELLRFAGISFGAAALAGCAATPTAAPAATEAPKVEEKPTEVPAATAPPAAGVKLTTMWRTSPTENEMLEKVIKVWAKKHPDITVEPIYAPWDEYEPKLLAMYAGGIAPDVLGIGGTNPFAERFIRGMVLSLQPFIEADTALREGLYPMSIKVYTLRGELCALPHVICPAGVSFNATRFDEAGLKYPPYDWNDESWTWEAMIALAKQLTVDKDGDGKIDQYGLNIGHRSIWYLTRMWGEDVVSAEDYAEGVMHKLNTDKPEVYEALVAGVTAVADAIHKDKVNPTPDTAQALGQMGPMLKTGAIAMEFTGGWAIWPPLPEEMKFGIAPNPLAKTRGKQVWVDPVQITSTTKYPKESWEFCKYLVSADESWDIQIEHRTVVPAWQPALPKYVDRWGGSLVLSKDEYQKFLSQCLEQATNDVPCHVLVGWAAARDAFIAELQPVWLGTKSPKEAVDTLIPLVNEKFQEKLQELQLAFHEEPVFGLNGATLLASLNGCEGCSASSGCSGHCAGCSKECASKKA